MADQDILPPTPDVPDPMAADGDPKEPQDSQPAQRKSGGWILLVLLSAALTIVAWLTMIWDEHVSFWTGVAGLCVAIAGAALVRRGIWRDIAITCIIACAALLLVYVIFYSAITYAINSL
ncbi:MAG: hypothetical protein LIP03_12665 [Bacteroidales bacterium]|nr:hypothetical protein [Bacteroidales bacterium]